MLEFKIENLNAGTFEKEQKHEDKSQSKSFDFYEVGANRRGGSRQGRRGRNSRSNIGRLSALFAQEIQRRFHSFVLHGSEVSIAITIRRKIG